MHNCMSMFQDRHCLIISGCFRATSLLLLLGISGLLLLLSEFYGYMYLIIPTCFRATSISFGMAGVTE